jgi:hypothetical protein
LKKHPLSVCLALGVSIALIVVACTITQKHGPGVYIYETYVEIYPGTKISSDDQKALNAVLKHFDKSLYKIKTYDRGKLVKTQGSLTDLEIDQILLIEAKKASLKGVSGLTDQIGNPNRVAHAPGVGHRPPSPLEKENRDSKRLVRLVTPILLKYSHDQMANVVRSAGR